MVVVPAMHALNRLGLELEDGKTPIHQLFFFEAHIETNQTNSCTLSFSLFLSRPLRIRLASEYGHVLVTIVPSDLLRLLRLKLHHPHTRISLKFLIRNKFPKIPNSSGDFIPLLGYILPLRSLILEMPQNPVVILLHIGNSIQQTARLQHIRVLGIQALRDNTSLVLARLEMRIRETNEDLGELVVAEEIGEEFHRVRPDTRDVLVVTRDDGCRAADLVIFDFWGGGGIGGCLGRRTCRGDLFESLLFEAEGGDAAADVFED